MTEGTGGTVARDVLVERLFKAGIGALEIFHIYLGDRLGLYRAIADRGPLSASELATAAGINRRYAREWLEEQAVAGLIEMDGRSDDPDERRYRLSPAQAEVLLDTDSVNFLAPLGQAMVGIGRAMPLVAEAFRTGGGVPYEAYGSEMRGAIERLNRPVFMNLMGAQWLPAIPDVDRRLREQPPARVADVGCGTGWSSIAIALAYPTATVDGIDLDSASIDEARRNAANRGVADRVSFLVRNAADPSLAGVYDLVTAFETIHDMADPVGALRAMRALTKSGGAVLIADEKAAHEFEAPGDDLERFLYGWSAVHCLPASMVEPGSAGTGTVMRPSTLRTYAQEAGFAEVEILAVETDSWRFYRLHP